MEIDIEIDDIVIGDRHRQDMGDLSALAESMADKGLLQSIVVRPDNLLVAGERRIRAAQMLGWTSIPARVLDIDSVLEAEHDENEIRKSFTTSERVAIGRAIEAKLGDRRRGPKPDPQNFADTGRETRDIAADKAGFGNAETYRQAKTVVDAGAPDLVKAVDDGDIAVSAAAQIASLPSGQQAEIMKKLTRDVDGHLTAEAQRHIRQLAKEVRAHDQKRKAERRERRETELGAKISALPDRRYGVILSDPEWGFQPYSRETGMDRAADNHYPTSSTDAIAQRPVHTIAADDCILFLWATAPMLEDALRVMNAWGFAYKTNVIWAKDRVGTGYWFRNKHELLLVGTKGYIPAPAMGTQFESLIQAPVTVHSAKPEIFLDMIERYFPNVPKIELNRRGPPRLGWDAWGNEADAGAAEEAHADPFGDSSSEVSAEPAEATTIEVEEMPDAPPPEVINYGAAEDVKFTVSRTNEMPEIPAFLRRNKS